MAAGYNSLAVDAAGDLFFHLPDELVLHVFKFLPAAAVCRSASVCRRFASLAHDPLLWKFLYLRWREERSVELAASGSSLRSGTESTRRVALDLWRWREAYQAQYNWARGVYTLRMVDTGIAPAAFAVCGTILTTTSRWDDSLHVWDLADTPPATVVRDGPSVYEERAARAVARATAAAAAVDCDAPDAEGVALGHDLAVLMSASANPALPPVSTFGRNYVQDISSLSRARSRFAWFMFFPFTSGSLVAGASRSKLKVWNFETGDELCTFSSTSHMWLAANVHLSSHIMAYSDGANVELYAVDTGTLISSVSVQHTVKAISDNYLVVAATDNPSVHVYALPSGRFLRASTEGVPSAVALEFDDERIIVSGYSGRLVAFSMATLEARPFDVAPEHGAHHCLAFDDTRLVAGSATGSINIFDLATYAHLFSINAHHSQVRSVYFDDMRIISISDDPVVCLIDFTPPSTDAADAEA